MVSRKGFLAKVLPVAFFASASCRSTFDVSQLENDFVKFISISANVRSSTDRNINLHSPRTLGELLPNHFEHEVEINKEAIATESLPNVTEALKRHYREFFADWFEPGAQMSRVDGGIRRRSSRKKNLHQKLVLSQMNTKKACKLDMDDRAKMVQYFSKPSDIQAVESVKIEDMFGTCWSIPRACPPLPTVITVQAPAGIGKSSMLKYMCM